MNIVFRVDSSSKMGVGHVMRCLSLAIALQERGCSIHFICREHEGHIIHLIEQKGFYVFKLSYLCHRVVGGDTDNVLFHSEWLGTSQVDDARECLQYLSKNDVDYLIIDHYAIDYRWEENVTTSCGQVMVIDDLADRKHCCDVLLDQTYQRDEISYQTFVDTNCQLLLGSRYALLRSEFIEWRDASLKRREVPVLKTLLISMGGVDTANVTEKILTALQACSLDKDLRIIVVMGATAVHLASIKEQAKQMATYTDVIVNASNMAELMAKSDLAIGAAGTTTWERAAVGLPSVVFCLAENQKQIALMLQAQGKAIVITERGQIKARLIAIFDDLNESLDMLATMTKRSAEMVDGLGASRVVQHLFREVNNEN